MYSPPCGRRFNNFKTLFEYLSVTNSNLHVDWFCFDVGVDCFDEFVAQGVRLEVEVV